MDDDENMEGMSIKMKMGCGWMKNRLRMKMKIE